MNPHADESYPVSVVLERHWRQYGQWRLPRWQIIRLLPRHLVQPDNNRDHLHTGDAQNKEQFVWSGLWLDLFRDELQSYYQNLTSKQPALFVLCRDDHPETGTAPSMVSANLADAEAHMETDGIVLSTPLAMPFSRWLAEYVLKNQPWLDKQLQELRHGKKGKRRHV